MTAIPIGELSHHTARCLALIKAGETIDITERGTIIGRIVPVNPELDVQARSLIERRIRPATRGRADLLADVHRRLDQRSVDTEGRASAALQELRDDARY